MSKFFRQYGIFLFIPGLVLVFTVLLKLASGPYWLAPNLDPAYQYLANGVYLAKGLVPNHTDHPGTPLQLLCCALCWLFNAGRPVGDLATRVLSAPEFYLDSVFTVLALFSFFTSMALGIYVFRKTGDRWAALLAQLPALSFLVLKSWETAEPVLPVVANVSPEPLMIGVLNLFNLCLMMSFFAKTSKEKSASTLWWGLVGGLGIAVKLTFIPILIVPLILLSWRDKIILMVVTAVSFVAWTFPIVSKYPIVWGWISGIATHSGDHAGGGGIASYWLNCKSIMMQQGAFAITVALTAALLIWKFAGKTWDRGTSFLAATLLGVVFQFAAVTQHPGAHYLLPGLGLFSALLVLFYLQGAAGYDRVRKIIIPVIALLIILGVGQAMVYRAKLAGLTRDIVTFHDQIAAKYQSCTFIDYYRSSDPAAALFFGDGWNLSPHLGKELFGLYPDKYYFHLWGNSIFNFNGRVWSNDLLTQNPCVLFRGDGNFNFNDGPYETRMLEQGRFGNIRALISTSEKQASMMMAGALHFSQTGDYAKALACALQARALHYQPDSSIESLVKIFKQYLQQ